MGKDLKDSITFSMIVELDKGPENLGTFRIERDLAKLPQDRFSASGCVMLVSDT